MATGHSGNGPSARRLVLAYQPGRSLRMRRRAGWQPRRSRYIASRVRTVFDNIHGLRKAVTMKRGTPQHKPTPNLRSAGIYSVAEASALIGASPQKVRAWVEGWPRTDTPPMIENDLGWVDNQLAFSFANLMELRFIAFFADANVKIREIRSIMEEVRAQVQRPHPFATNVVFMTDGVKIVAEIAHKNGVASLFDLRTKNFEMKDVVYRSLKEGIVYDPAGDAQAWFPRQLLAPNVIIHPKLAFGRPVLKGTNIPIEAIVDSVRSEGSIEGAAIVFEITKRKVEEAVRFDTDLRRAA